MRKLPFFWGPGGDDYGACLRYPPQVVANDGAIKSTRVSPRFVKLLAAGNGDPSLKTGTSLPTMKNSLRTNVSLTTPLKQLPSLDSTG